MWNFSCTFQIELVLMKKSPGNGDVWIILQVFCEDTPTERE